MTTEKKTKKVWYTIGLVVEAIVCIALAYLIARIPGVIALVLVSLWVWYWVKQVERAKNNTGEQK